MVRVSILLSKDDKVPKKLIDVSGCTKDDKGTLLKVIESAFNSDDWIPE